MGESSQGFNDADADTDALTSKLIDEFKSSLDDTLIIAILSDYDLTTHFSDARSILEGLAQTAAAEELSGFNAAGVGGGEDQETVGHIDTNCDGDVDRVASPEWPSDTTNSSTRFLADYSSKTDCSDTLSERFAALELPNDVNITALDEDGKVAELRIMFTELTEMDVKMVLKRVNGDFTKACEELLNIQYLEEHGLRPKGIDGAFRLDDMIGYKGRPETRKEKGKNRLDINYSLAPPDLSEDDVPIPTAGPSKVTTPLGRRSSLPRISTASSPAPKAIYSAPESPAIKSTAWQTVQPKRKVPSERVVEAAPADDPVRDSFRAAQQAYRRGASDRHFRTVAAVLGERVREQRQVAKAAEIHKYYALVDKNSSDSHIDLHGVPVAEGVRIALERTQMWWSGLGEDRARKAREEGFSVVTGLGNHSANGFSRLRQDVGAALKREGWRVRVETGQFVVTGKNQSYA